MAVKLRLMRMGKKKQPTYRVVAADARSPRDGRFIEIVGFYDPRRDPSVVKIDNDKALRWLRDGAKPTERVEKLLKISGAWEEFSGEPPPPAVTRIADAASDAAEAVADKVTDAAEVVADKVADVADAVADKAEDVAEAVADVAATAADSVADAAEEVADSTDDAAEATDTSDEGADTPADDTDDSKETA
ncbi:MAG: 30S ribosomal protein S16 [Acidimicrobiales bacterium]